MASMRPRTRKDGSTFWEVLFRHDGRQRSLSFETADHAGKFKELVGLVGPGKALAAYDLAPAPRAANGSSVTVAEWVEHHIEHLIGCEQKTIDEYRRFLKRDIAPGLGPNPADVPDGRAPGPMGARAEGQGELRQDHPKQTRVRLVGAERCR